MQEGAGVLNAQKQAILDDASEVVTATRTWSACSDGRSTCRAHGRGRAAGKPVSTSAPRPVHKASESLAPVHSIHTGAADKMAFHRSTEQHRLGPRGQARQCVHAYEGAGTAGAPRDCGTAARQHRG